MIKKTTLILLIFSSFLACSKTDNKTPFDILGYQKEFVTKEAIPLTKKFVTDVNALNSSIIKFSSGINNENLLSLKKDWEQAAVSFSQSEMLNLGKITETSVYFSLYSWGANQSFIDDYIASSKIISEDKISTIPTNARGLSSIEYLIFEQNNAQTIASFSTNQRKLDYLVVLGKNMLTKANYLNEQWKNYSDSFMNNTSSGINGSINLIVNQMSLLLENVKTLKIGQAAGFKDSTTPIVNNLQADKSGISLKLIKENIASVKTAYFGQPLGLDDYVSSIIGNEKLNAKIKSQFTAIENNVTTLSTTNTTLKNAIVDNLPLVKKLYDNTRALITSIKTDVPTALAVTITFTDNDGD